MSAIQKHPLMSEAEYLEFERASETKHEYFNGRVSEREGASVMHSSISMSLTVALYPQVRASGFKMHSSNMRLKIMENGFYTYPDTAIYPKDIICLGALRDIVINPIVIIEILSSTTETYDRGLKFERYQQITTLQEYVLVSQDKPCIERFLRQEDGTWNYLKVEGLDKSIVFPSINATLVLANAYELVNFEEGD